VYPFTNLKVYLSLIFYIPNVHALYTKNLYFT